jgi:hypothetical protein
MDRFKDNGDNTLCAVCRPDHIRAVLLIYWNIVDRMDRDSPVLVAQRAVIPPKPPSRLQMWIDEQEAESAVSARAVWIPVEVLVGMARLYRRVHHLQRLEVTIAAAQSRP